MGLKKQLLVPTFSLLRFQQMAAFQQALIKKTPAL